MSTITDTYGDVITVSTGDEKVYVSIVMSPGTPDVNDADVELPFEKAVSFAENVLTAINDILTPEQREQVEALRAMFVTPATVFGETEQDERAGWNQDAIAAAIEYQRTARFSYEKQSGPGGIIERRTLAPTEICYTLDGAPFVVGYDTDREDVRAFRLDRIVGYVEVS